MHAYIHDAAAAAHDMHPSNRAKPSRQLSDMHVWCFFGSTSAMYASVVVLHYSSAVCSALTDNDQQQPLQPRLHDYDCSDMSRLYARCLVRTPTKEVGWQPTSCIRRYVTSRGRPSHSLDSPSRYVVHMHVHSRDKLQLTLSYLENPEPCLKPTRCYQWHQSMLHSRAAPRKIHFDLSSSVRNENDVM